VSVCVSSTLPTLAVSNVDETAVWEEILRQHGLGENRGRNTNWLEYGARYFDHEHAITYDTADKRPHKRTTANLDRAKQLLKAMGTGLSMKKAAKQLGIPQQTACYILKKYREISTLPTSHVSSEGKQ
jgi:hypothetical protein